MEESSVVSKNILLPATITSPMDESKPPPSPLSGAYLLIVISEPQTETHKSIILQKLAKAFLSWDIDASGIDIERELAIVTALSPEGDFSKNGERLIQNASEHLVTEILIHPQINTMRQCIRNLLSSFTKYRFIIHSGYAFCGNGSWILQDGTFSICDFIDAFQEIEVQRVIKAYEKNVKVDICCISEGSWNQARINQEAFTKICQIEINPRDKISSGNVAVREFVDYLTKFVIASNIEELLEPSDIVGNIRFTHPTLYVFPGGEGDAALFGINGFNMLVDGGFNRKACFWNFVRHLDRLDAVLLTRVNNCNMGGMAGIIQRKVFSPIYPQIGHFFSNIQTNRNLPSPDGDKDKEPLLVNLIEEGHRMVTNLKQLQLKPHSCYRNSNTDPINLYHKVGHGKLDMYVISPAKDSREVKEFLSRWNNHDVKVFGGASSKTEFRELRVPLQNLISICALLVWQPAKADDRITRILFPGSAPEHRIFEGLEKFKHLEILKYSTCTTKSISTLQTTGIKASTKAKLSASEKIISEESGRGDIKVALHAENEVDGTSPTSKIISETRTTVRKIKRKPVEKSVMKDGLDAKPIKKIEKQVEDSNNIGVAVTDTIISSPSTITDGLTSNAVTSTTVNKIEDKKKFDSKKTTKADIKKYKPPISLGTADKKSESEKSSPTTPKKMNGLAKLTTADVTKESATLKSTARAATRTRTPPKVFVTAAKSVKEENNRKMAEAKQQQSRTKTPPKSTVISKSLLKKEEDTKVEKKPMAIKKEKLSSVKPASMITTDSKKSISIRSKNIQKQENEKTDLSADVMLAKSEDCKIISDVKDEDGSLTESFKLSDPAADTVTAATVIAKTATTDVTEADKKNISTTAYISNVIMKKEEKGREVDHDRDHDDIDDEDEVLIIETTEMKPINYDEQKYQRDEKESEKNKQLILDEMSKESDGTFVKKETSGLDNTIDRTGNVQLKSIKDEALPKTEHVITPEEKHTLFGEVDGIISKAKEIIITSGKEVAEKPYDDGKDLKITPIKDEKVFSTFESSSTTSAPTMPEDERVDDDLKQEIEEKYDKEETKEKPTEVSSDIAQPKQMKDENFILDEEHKHSARKPSLPPPSPPSSKKDIVKTPDEVAELPAYEEADMQIRDDDNSKETVHTTEGQTTAAQPVIDVIVPQHAEFVTITPTPSSPDEKPFSGAIGSTLLNDMKLMKSPTLSVEEKSSAISKSVLEQKSSIDKDEWIITDNKSTNQSESERTTTDVPETQVKSTIEADKIKSKKQPDDEYEKKSNENEKFDLISSPTPDDLIKDSRSNESSLKLSIDSDLKETSELQPDKIVVETQEQEKIQENGTIATKKQENISKDNRSSTMTVKTNEKLINESEQQNDNQYDVETEKEIKDFTVVQSSLEETDLILETELKKPVLDESFSSQPITDKTTNAIKESEKGKETEKEDLYAVKKKTDDEKEQQEIKEQKKEQQKDQEEKVIEDITQKKIISSPHCDENIELSRDAHLKEKNMENIDYIEERTSSMQKVSFEKSQMSLSPTKEEIDQLQLSKEKAELDSVKDITTEQKQSRKQSDKNEIETATNYEKEENESTISTLSSLAAETADKRKPDASNEEYFLTKKEIFSVPTRSETVEDVTESEKVSLNEFIDERRKSSVDTSEIEINVTEPEKVSLKEFIDERRKSSVDTNEIEINVTESEKVSLKEFIDERRKSSVDTSEIEIKNHGENVNDQVLTCTQFLTEEMSDQTKSLEIIPRNGKDAFEQKGTQEAKVHLKEMTESQLSKDVKLLSEKLNENISDRLQSKTSPPIFKPTDSKSDTYLEEYTEVDKISREVPQNQKMTEESDNEIKRKESLSPEKVIPELLPTDLATSLTKKGTEITEELKKTPEITSISITTTNASTNLSVSGDSTTCTVSSISGAIENGKFDTASPKQEKISDQLSEEKVTRKSIVEQDDSKLLEEEKLNGTKSEIIFAEISDEGLKTKPQETNIDKDESKKASEKPEVTSPVNKDIVESNEVQRHDGKTDIKFENEKTEYEIHENILFDEVSTIISPVNKDEMKAKEHHLDQTDTLDKAGSIEKDAAITSKHLLPFTSEDETKSELLYESSKSKSEEQTESKLTEILKEKSHDTDNDNESDKDDDIKQSTTQDDISLTSESSQLSYVEKLKKGDQILYATEQQEPVKTAMTIDSVPKTYEQLQQKEKMNEQAGSKDVPSKEELTLKCTDESNSEIKSLYDEFDEIKDKTSLIPESQPEKMEKIPVNNETNQLWSSTLSTETEKIEIPKDDENKDKKIIFEEFKTYDESNLQKPVIEINEKVLDDEHKKAEILSHRMDVTVPHGTNLKESKIILEDKDNTLSTFPGKLTETDKSVIEKEIKPVIKLIETSPKDSNELAEDTDTKIKMKHSIPETTEKIEKETTVKPIETQTKDTIKLSGDIDVQIEPSLQSPTEPFVEDANVKQDKTPHEDANQLEEIDVKIKIKQPTQDTIRPLEEKVNAQQLITPPEDITPISISLKDPSPLTEHDEKMKIEHSVNEITESLEQEAVFKPLTTFPKDSQLPEIVDAKMKVPHSEHETIKLFEQEAVHKPLITSFEDQRELTKDIDQKVKIEHSGYDTGTLEQKSNVLDRTKYKKESEEDLAIQDQINDDVSKILNANEFEGTITEKIETSPKETEEHLHELKENLNQKSSEDQSQCELSSSKLYSEWKSVESVNEEKSISQRDATKDLTSFAEMTVSSHLDDKTVSHEHVGEENILKKPMRSEHELEQCSIKSTGDELQFKVATVTTDADCSTVDGTALQQSISFTPTSEPKISDTCQKTEMQGTEEVISPVKKSDSEKFEKSFSLSTITTTKADQNSIPPSLSPPASVPATIVKTCSLSSDTSSMSSESERLSDESIKNKVSSPELHLDATQLSVRFKSDKKEDAQTKKFAIKSKSNDEESHNKSFDAQDTTSDLSSKIEKKESVVKTVSLPILDERFEEPSKTNAEVVDVTDDFSKSYSYFEKIPYSETKTSPTNLSDPSLFKQVETELQSKSVSLPVIKRSDDSDKYMTLPHLYKTNNLEDLTAAKTLTITTTTTTTTTVTPLVTGSVEKSDRSYSVESKVPEAFTTGIVPIKEADDELLPADEKTLSETSENVSDDELNKIQSSSQNLCPTKDTQSTYEQQPLGTIVHCEVYRTDDLNFGDGHSFTPLSDVRTEQLPKIIQPSNDKQDSHSQIFECDKDSAVPLAASSSVSSSETKSTVEEEEEKHGSDYSCDQTRSTSFDKMATSMTQSFYGVFPDEKQSFKYKESENKQEQHLESKPDLSNDKMKEDLKTLTASVTSSNQNKDETEELSSTTLTQKDPIQDWGKPLGLPAARSINSLHSWNPLENWGKPLGLPSPGPMLPLSSTQHRESNGDIEISLAPINAKGTPKRNTKKIIEKNKSGHEPSKTRDHSTKKNKPTKQVVPVYVDLAYVPHHGNPYYTTVEFFKQIRARYYVFSGTDPSKDVFNALLEGKKCWENPDLEVTIISTYDTDALGYWITENEETLENLKIDLAPSASRCTINLQDHDTSCSAYRLEF